MTTMDTRGNAALRLPTCPSAAETAANVRAGRGSAADACAAALARIAETESQVRAWAYLNDAQALEQARSIDAAGAEGALAGVPVAVKDIVDTADQPTENGTRLDAGRRPDTDATVVRRLRAAGALIPGKTVTTELACGAANETRNPHALAHNAGRLVVRLGRDRGRRRRAARAWHTDCRLGGATSHILRRMGHEAELRHDPAHRGHAALAILRPCRRACGLG